MPELPDILLYLHALAPRIVGQRLDRVRLESPFLLRSVDPPLAAIEGHTVTGLDRIGKRIVWAFDGDVFAVFHLMIAGRFRWRPSGARTPRKAGLAAFEFSTGTLVLTEAGSRRRSSLMLVRGVDRLHDLNPGGIDPLTCGPASFSVRLRLENHTLKRALTDPRLFSGIGNAYSDEILHAAQLSPLQLTRHLDEETVERLHRSTVETLGRWIEQLRSEIGDAFPEKVTAFREGMAVHGRFGRPCPRCGALVLRIAYADSECNYCAACQTGGRLLADRSLSRLMRGDWPRTLDDLEQLKAARREP
jgi:formamidopyrimidine-DNA glycosylase